MVEVIDTGGVHEGLVEVGAGVDAPRDDELAGGVDDLGPARDHQLPPHLLDDAILDVDIGLEGAVVVHHFPPLDEDPHGGRVGHHGAAGQRQRRGERREPPGAGGPCTAHPRWRCPGAGRAQLRILQGPCRWIIPGNPWRGGALAQSWGLPPCQEPRSRDSRLHPTSATHSARPASGAGLPDPIPATLLCHCHPCLGDTAGRPHKATALTSRAGCPPCPCE